MTDDDLFRKAVDAAYARVPGVTWDDMAAALRAAGDVYDEAANADVDRVMAETGFAGMDITDNGARIRLKHAADLAAGMVAAFDELIYQRGAENYVEWESTVTDPAREQAIRDGLPPEEWPPHRQYTFTVIRPNGKTPHELRRDAEYERDWLLAEAPDELRERFFATRRRAAGEQS